MKKIRMIVSAAVVLAAVGSTLAFTNAKFDASYCVESAQLPVRAQFSTGPCTVFLNNLTEIGATQFHWAKPANAATECVNATCPARKVKNQ
jgi:hypothetical protein